MKLLEKFKELIDKDILENREEHSMFNSELYLFWKYAKEYDIDRIVESGTYMGRSATILSKLFPNHEIITFDNDRKHFDKCKDIPNVLRVLGELDLDIITRKTAVLIDGPKRKLATRLARKCLKAGAVLCGIHDMYEYISYLKKKFKILAIGDKFPPEIEALDIGISDKIKWKFGKYGGCITIVTSK